jgi:protoporphyrinogen oxidase
LFEAIKNAVFQGKGNKHATLVDQFAYPSGGTGSVYESMQRQIESRGGKVFLETGIQQVITVGGRAHAVVLENGEQKDYDQIISTMPLSLLLERLPEVPGPVLAEAKKLTFRNTILVYLRVDRSDLFTDQWLYIHDPSVEVGRVTNFRNWLPSVYGESSSSILCLEYWCYFNDPLWNMEPGKLIEKAGAEIIMTGLVPSGEVKEGHVVRLPRCYPVYFRGYREVMKPLETYLNTVDGLHAIGRYGAYKYNNQDHSILMGMRVAEKLLEGARHDLWSINTDYETYQESSVITKTGLVTFDASN